MSILIVGGTSGLGFELAKHLQTGAETVYVTGRRAIHHPGLHFEPFDLSAAELPRRTEELLGRLPEITTLIYTAGFFQDGRITDLTEDQIEEMLNVGGRGLVYFVRAILRRQERLKELVTITSTSHWIPRQKEPVYCFAKAGAAHFSNALAEDGRIDKVLVAGPAGMKTAFWNSTERNDLGTMLDPTWVAQEIQTLRQERYKFKFARIMRGPARVEIAEMR